MGSFMGALGQDAALCFDLLALQPAPTSFLFGVFLGQKKFVPFLDRKISGAMPSTAFPAAHLCVPDSVFAALLRR
jgi:hypothetical protein